VHPAASIAAAASTAFPPLAKICAPAVAESGLPVIASQCLAWSGGFSVGPVRGSAYWRASPSLAGRCAPIGATKTETADRTVARRNEFAGRIRPGGWTAALQHVAA